MEGTVTMVEMDKYIDEGKVKRDKIVADVKRGRLSKEDIKQLDSNEIIRSSYFGDVFSTKDKKEWNEKYLDELSLAAVSEVFNKEYLIKLHEIANYVIDNKKKKENIDKIIRLCVCGFAAVVLIALILKLIN